MPIENSRKRLFVDIETSPNTALIWKSGYKLNVGHDNIIEERKIICICWKWEDKKAVHSVSWDEDRDDKKLLLEFIDVLTDANEIVAHNGDRYDIKWIRTRCLVHGISMPPKLKTIDTLKLAKSLFSFNSNRLDYIGKFIADGGKMETGGFDLWKRIKLQNCQKSLKKMIDYCKQDVILLQKVFDKINPYAENKQHYALLYGGDDRYTCPECGSHKSSCNKTTTTVRGVVQRQMKCKACYKYFTISNKSYMDKLADERDGKI